MSACHRLGGAAARYFPVIVASFLAAAFFSVHPALASTGFRPVNPEELKMVSEPQAPGAAAVILFRQVDRDDDRYAPHEDVYERIKILKEEGREQANVEVAFSKGFEDVANVHARTIEPDGSIVEFDGKVFEKTIVKRRGSEYLAKTFVLPNVEVGSIIEYYYTINYREYYVFESHWILSQELFTRDAKFSLKPYRSPYHEFNLRWSWQRLPQGSAPKQGPSGIVEMEAQNIPAFQHEDFMPPENELKARVDFIYDRERPESNVDKFWQNVGKKRYEALESFVGKRSAMEQAVAQITSPTDTPEVKLRKIYDRVQQIRNTSYEIRKTEQEEKRDKEKPATNVEEVWKRGYGNGQQLTWLFLALARAAGFEGYGCWVSDRSNYFFETQTMQSQKLNANVVLIKLNGQDVYFDPGAQFTPFGLLTWSETGVPGLRLDQDGGAWIQTTLPHAPESQFRREAKLELSSETGDLEGELTVTFTGLEAMYRRLRERHEDEAARKRYLEDILKEQVPVAAELELTNQPDWNSSESPLVAVLKVKIPSWASSAGKRATLPVGFFVAREKHIFEHTNREHAVYFEYPFEKLDDVTVKLPEGWKVNSVPPPQSLDGKLILYSMKVDNSSVDVHVVRKLDMDMMILPSESYPALRNFFQKVRSDDEQQVLLQPAASSASN